MTALITSASVICFEQYCLERITTFLFHVLQVRAAFRERRILVPFEVVLMEKVWTVVTCVTVICWI